MAPSLHAQLALHRRHEPCCGAPTSGAISQGSQALARPERRRRCSTAKAFTRRGSRAGALGLCTTRTCVPVARSTGRSHSPICVSQREKEWETHAREFLRLWGVESTRCVTTPQTCMPAFVGRQCLHLHLHSCQHGL